MSTSTPLCSICTTHESKYKCPFCGLRSCSLACYKQHQPFHTTTTTTTTTTSSSCEDPTTTTQPQHASPSSPPRPDRPRPGPTNHRPVPPKRDMTRFASDPDFLALLHRYPRLRIQLQALYALTLEPGPEDARNWAREALPGEAAAAATGPMGYNSRGRGGRGGRGGRRGGRGRGGNAFREPPSEGRQGGVWTAEKGEKEALGTMRRMRSGGRRTSGGGGGGDKAEGLKEFVELCMLRFGPESQREEEGEGMTG